MDVRSIEKVQSSGVHQDTVENWWLFEPRELKRQTLGGYLEHVDEFEVRGGGEINPHQHHTWEFYYVLSGRGIMTIGDESREVAQGDLIAIPPDAIHSLRPLSANASIRCFAFAVGLKDTPEVDYKAE
jgi:mannose-6-phosphate isomerase-like protein (cupin superfamily)